MATPRKMLGKANSPYIISLMRLIDTPSKATIMHWCVTYAGDHILPIYERHIPGDNRPRLALMAATDWTHGRVKLPEAKQHILGCHAAARETEENPAAQAAARAIGPSASTIHMPTHPLGLAV